MHRLATTLTIATLAAAFAVPAAAADFIHDGATMFSPATVARLNEKIANFNSATGKQIVVVTTPSLSGASLQQAASSAFTQQNVNGVLVFIARDDRRDIIVPDRAGTQAGWFTPDVIRSIRTPMEQSFRAEDYDGGVTQAVDGILGVYRQHVQNRGNLAPSQQYVPATAARQPATTGVHLSMFWWIIILVIGFLIVRSIMRASAMPRYGPGGPGNAPPGAMPPGGYGPGYGGYGGGGGSFWSGLLGGLGGAWLGNEMFGQRGGGALGPGDAGQAGLTGGTGTDANAGGWGDSSGGWQNDAGQADMSGSSSGDWSGGGFGGGDGGGGGDFGGGGGDSGGGW